MSIQMFGLFLALVSGALFWVSLVVLGVHFFGVGSLFVTLSWMTSMIGLFLMKIGA